MKDRLILNLKKGDFIKVRRKPTWDNSAVEVFRTIREIDFKKKIIFCDDNIDYKFKDIL
jgi:hypothetical protein